MSKQAMEAAPASLAFLLEHLPENVKVTERRCDAGQMISDCPNGVPSVGIIGSGRVDVYSVAIDGRDVQLNSLGVGESFGICNLLAPAEMQTVLRCAEDAVIHYIPKRSLLKAMEQDTELALQYAQLCNRKIQFLIRRIELLTMQTCRGKVLAWLLAQKDEKGCVKVKGSRDDLARMLGISRAALFRELSSLQSQGLLTAEGTVFQVLDVRRLERLLYQPYSRD